MPEKYVRRESYEKSKPTNIFSPNRYQLLEPTSEKNELVSENIQNTESLRLSGNENELNRNRNVLTSQNTGNKRPSVVIHKYPEKQTNFRCLLLSLVLYYLVELLYYQKVKETF